MNSALADHAAQVFAKLSEEFVDDSSQDALVRNRESFKDLSTLARMASFTQELVKRNPAINTETLAIAVEAVINLEKSRSGVALLEKLTKLGEADVEGLDRLLRQWSVHDALSVLDEIVRIAERLFEENRLAASAPTSGTSGFQCNGFEVSAS